MYAITKTDSKECFIKSFFTNNGITQCIIEFLETNKIIQCNLSDLDVID